MAYVNPLPNGATRKRSDQGRDYQGKPGDPVVAIGRARIDAVKSDPGGFGNVVYYTLLDGPRKGQQIYVGHAGPTVKAGQIVAAGAQVAKLLQVSGGNASNLPGWTEIGLAQGGVPKFSGGTQGGVAFDALLKGAKTVPIPGTRSPVPTNGTPTSTDVSGGTSARLAQEIGMIPQATGADAPLASAPLSEDATNTNIPTTNNAAQTWQLIASQGNVSPDTLRLAQMAQYGANGTPSTP